MARCAFVLTTSNHKTYPAELAEPETVSGKQLLCLQHLKGSRTDCDPLRISGGFGEELLGYLWERNPSQLVAAFLSCRLCDRPAGFPSAGPRFPRANRRPI